MRATHTLHVGLEWLVRGRRKTFSSRTELEKWQHRRVLRFLHKTLPLSPALRQRLMHLDPEQWRCVEPIGKAEMMRSFDSLLTVPVTEKNAWETALSAERNREIGKIGPLSVGMSSGTSGTRGLFVVSSAEKARWAGAVLGRVLHGNVFAKHRIALLLRANSGLYETLGGRNISFRYIDILRSPEKWVDELTDFEPTIIAGPPSILRHLSEIQRKNGCRLSPLKIYSVAEVLDDIDRDFIRQTWDVPLLQIYQATEGFLGISIDEKRILLNEDLLVIEQEWIDRGRKLFAPVITDFSRVTQPIIRYRLDDVLEETESGEWAPYRAVSRIHGRITDMLYLGALDGKSVKMPGDLISRAIIAADVPMRNHEIIQRKPNELILSIEWLADSGSETTRECQKDMESSIRQWCERAGLMAPLCRFVPYVATPDPSTKYRRIRQYIDTDKTEQWA